MDVPALTTEQIAAMLPDQLREYGALLSTGYTLATAEVSDALREKLEADTARLKADARLQVARNEQKGLKDRMSLVQSLMKSVHQF